MALVLGATHWIAAANVHMLVAPSTTRMKHYGMFPSRTHRLL